jgi:hypothetical protein
MTPDIAAAHTIIGESEQPSFWLLSLEHFLQLRRGC